LVPITPFLDAKLSYRIEVEQGKKAIPGKAGMFIKIKKKLFWAFV
jgi:hypothetical protein